MGTGPEGMCFSPYFPYPPFPKDSLLWTVLCFSKFTSNNLGNHLKQNTGLSFFHIHIALHRLVESQTPFLPVFFSITQLTLVSRSGRAESEVHRFIILVRNTDLFFLYSAILYSHWNISDRMSASPDLLSGLFSVYILDNLTELSCHCLDMSITTAWHD